MPDFMLENALNGTACGIDEVGRGPLAGPVVSACAYIPPLIRKMDFIKELQDSKRLSKSKLSRLSSLIHQHCLVGFGQCDPTEIDEINILHASMKAMKRAYLDLCNKHPDLTFDHALIDGNRSPTQMPCLTHPVIKGDQKSCSIAAAAIVAKVMRDQYMQKLAEDFPHYGWESNAAYPTRRHLDALKTHGITPHHRRSFAPVRACLN